MKQQRWKTGAVVVVPLAEGWHTYAQMLQQPEYAFFDARTRTQLPTEDVVGSPVLFRLWVMSRAHTKGRWRIVFTVPVVTALRDPVPRFKQDAIQPAQVTVLLGTTERAATVLECHNLERAAVWDPEHVEDRLNDWYAGRPNRWAESLRIKT